MKTVTNRRRLERQKSSGLSGLQEIRGDVLRRSVILALIIGSALTLFNQFNALLGSAPIRTVPLILAYLTPFLVIAISQVAGIRQARFDAGQERVQRIEERLVATALSHGIPARAVMIGLILGATNAAIILTATYGPTGEAGTTSFVVLGQAFALPVLFGSLSQAIAYRRAAQLIAE